MKDTWELIIGLEIHAQLNTRTKIFSPTAYQFGSEPNENIGIVDTGQPGALPVLNLEAVHKAAAFGCAVDAEVALFSKFDRKSYFYPDSPRGFQITQFDQPIVIGGKVHADGKTFTIEHAHLEDDAGMLKHFSSFAGVDYNRAGVPLIEIVSDPCMRSPSEASSYAMAVRAILQYIDAADCNMEEGGMRMDVNVSVRPKGSTELRPKIEIKNMNSFFFMEMAIEAEYRRQTNIYENGGTIKQSTFRFDPATERTIEMRSKEEAKDYRYFPEPDLPPIVLTREFVDEIRKNLPELPHQRRERYLNTLNLTEYSTNILISDKALSDHYETALKHTSHAIPLCNWLTAEFVGRIKDTHQPLPPPEDIATLVNLIHDKTITGKIAKKVADDMLSTGKSPTLIIEENPDYKPVSDTSTLEPIIDQVLKDNPQSIEDFKAGKDRAFNYLVGQIMKASRGKASPDIVKELLSKKL
ncbi:MAG: Aspartyl/glutamyl-tRNA(Asn/Gln) amidotransferase subunit B [Chlamydiia bacterium]|nr:Aspartyl/glutamyl-tRNA(Asn/Gln) amidotransferase subunit B [Chlamydiia bacterium]MCH9615544.1 Aspartyl/glutamyl-tRNA(Asn/Gln) amidotransferase subunit B [Chlamydiia bacterium]MCH9629199.1 Aspartyl/glutamyl-tRNA(Asn/Gln) amidotransferase subunit B [Chlamydiia bacterium]